jgi:hypothetical protein
MSPFTQLMFKDGVSRLPDAADLLVRAMCHHHLGQPKEAGICLRMTREMLGKEAGSADEKALLREAETLIEGKAPP